MISALPDPLIARPGRSGRSIRNGPDEAASLQSYLLVICRNPMPASIAATKTSGCQSR